MDNSFKEQFIIIEKVKQPKELDIRTSDTNANQHLKIANDADHADSNRIANHEFVHRKSIPQASMSIYSGISTFSMALPSNSTLIQ